MNYEKRIIGCEIDPVHFDTACKRIEAFYAVQGGLFAPEQLLAVLE